MRRKERPFSDSLGENRGRVNDLVQLGDQAAGANRERLARSQEKPWRQPRWIDLERAG